MKILWFSNTPCSSSEKLTPGLNIGGWLSSLEKVLSKNAEIELHISFYYSQKIKPFDYNNTHFFPIYRKNSGSKISRFITRLLNKEHNDKAEIKKLLSVIELVKPDLIHVHGTEENFGLIQHYIDLPVVISIQGIRSVIFEKYHSGISYSIAKKYESFKNKILVKSTRYNYNQCQIGGQRERKILMITKNIIGRTDWDRRVTNVLAPNSRYYTGQEMLRESFYPNEWNKLKFNSITRIVTVLNNGIYKGFEVIVKAANILLAYPNFDFEWLVIGLNENSETAVLVRNWLEIDFDRSNIQLLGSKSEEEVVKLLLSSDIYCQVSHIENSPNSLCEAMILGMPIIATYAGGTNSMLENSKEGILVQDGDPYSLSGAILELSNDFKKATEYAQAARLHAIVRHDKEKISSDLFHLYQSIINKI